MEKKKEDKKINDHEKSTGSDPQEHMKGPLSSLVQGVKEGVEENDAESKEEADKKKERNT